MTIKNRLAKLESIRPQKPDARLIIPDEEVERLLADTLPPLSERRELSEAEVKAVMRGRKPSELTDKELDFLIVGYER